MRKYLYLDVSRIPSTGDSSLARLAEWKVNCYKPQRTTSYYCKSDWMSLRYQRACIAPIKSYNLLASYMKSFLDGETSLRTNPDKSCLRGRHSCIYFQPHCNSTMLTTTFASRACQRSVYPLRIHRRFHPEFSELTISQLALTS